MRPATAHRANVSKPTRSFRAKFTKHAIFKGLIRLAGERADVGQRGDRGVISDFLQNVVKVNL